jgi:hypothetical protein
MFADAMFISVCALASDLSVCVCAFVCVQVQAWVQRFVDAAYHQYRKERAESEYAPPRAWPRPVEVSWDTILDQYLYPLGGFGIDGLQVYIKRVVTLTPPHTEIAYSSAMNLMRHNSVGKHPSSIARVGGQCSDLLCSALICFETGAAIWVGFYFKDLLSKYSAEEARSMMVCNTTSP